MRFCIKALPEKDKLRTTGRTHKTAQKGYPEKAIADEPLKRAGLKKSISLVVPDKRQVIDGISD